MCIICILWDRDAITSAEAKKALWEQVMVDDVTDEQLEHMQKVYADLDKHEAEEKSEYKEEDQS